MASLRKKQLHHLRQLAHELKPVVMIGNKGLTENVIEEINIAIDHHELIKVKINAADRNQKEKMIAEILETCQAEKVMAVGHIVGLYKKADEPKIILPK